MTSEQAGRARAQIGTPIVGIIGAGFAGLAAAIKLRESGIETFHIFEQSEDLGGTWWDNRYPGAEVDTPSVIYSFSFRPSGWSRTHVRQAELLQYMNDVVDEYNLRPKIRLGARVDSATWDSAKEGYLLDVGGELIFVNVLISAVGFLNMPRFPNWPGVDDFQGPVFHTSRWEHEHDLHGKHVAVVGTGSSAIQIVPTIADTAGQVTLFQREPGWILPKHDRELEPHERAQLRQRSTARWVRLKTLFSRELKRAKGTRPGTPAHTASQAAAERFIDSVFLSRPDLKAAVTPSYPFGGKRTIWSDHFYPSLLRENVKLVPRAVASVTDHGIVDVTGVEHPCDVIALATGFQATDYQASVRVTGRSGATLQETWAGEPEALLGMMVPGFPNFFMMYGPNTNGPAIVTHLELQAGYVASAVSSMRRRGYAVVEARESVHRMYNDWLQRNLKGTAWDLSNNYFKTASGRIVTQWPFGPVAYAVLVKALGRPAWIVRKLRPVRMQRARWRAAATSDSSAHSVAALPLQGGSRDRG